MDDHKVSPASLEYRPLIRCVKVGGCFVQDQDAWVGLDRPGYTAASLRPCG